MKRFSVFLPLFLCLSLHLVSFQLFAQGAGVGIAPVSAPQQEEKVYEVVDEQPSFRGGEKARMRYLVEAINYPDEAVDNGIEGVVFVQFVVEKDGSVSNVKLLRGVHDLLDEEALRVVSGMPSWNPGKVDGKPVRVLQTLPVRFRLSR